MFHFIYERIWTNSFTLPDEAGGRYVASINVIHFTSILLPPRVLGAIFQVRSTGIMVAKIQRVENEPRVLGVTQN